MAKTKTEPMVEHRVTVVVRYPLTGAVPSLAETIDTVIARPKLPAGSTASVEEMRVKTVRVPVSENGAGK